MRGRPLTLSKARRTPMRPRPWCSLATSGWKGAGVEVREFDLEQVLEEPVETGAMQKVLYAIESFEQIYEATKEAESRLG